MTLEFPQSVRRELLAAARGAADVELLDVMLLLAHGIDPHVEPDDCRTRIDELAELARAAMDPHEAEPARVRAFVEAMRSFGFHGNRENYYDPRNSLLPDVLERRTGIPIALAVLFMEVARLAGLALRGVNFPFHFLLRSADAPNLFVDPFFCVVRDEASCADLLYEISGGTMAAHAEHLRPIDARQIFVRVLRNLKNIQKQSGAVYGALEYCDMILEFDPEQPLEYRDRGSICLALGEWNRAVDDLSTYLAIAPTAPDRSVVLGQLQYVLSQHNSVH